MWEPFLYYTTIIYWASSINSCSRGTNGSDIYLNARARAPIYAIIFSRLWTLTRDGCQSITTAPARGHNHAAEQGRKYFFPGVSFIYIRAGTIIWSREWVRFGSVSLCVSPISFILHHEAEYGGWFPLSLVRCFVCGSDGWWWKGVVWIFVGRDSTHSQDKELLSSQDKGRDTRWKVYEKAISAISSPQSAPLRLSRRRRDKCNYKIALMSQNRRRQCAT